MKTNVARTHSAKTHEGGRADPHQSPLVELTRAVSTCLLFEDTFYEKGSDLAARMAGLCAKVSGEELAALAVKARTDLKLRHVPLFLCVQLAKLHRGKSFVAATIQQVVQRPDELGELLSLYWKEKRSPISAQVKKGLAKAMQKFSAYQLAKWNREAAIKVRDVLFLVHAKPKDEAQAATWKQLVDGTLESPDTWEVALSSGKDKKETWERLLTEKKLGYIALLMNLRNMATAKVEPSLVESVLRDGAKGSRALPFRFVSAYKHAPEYAQALSDAMELAVDGQMNGHTAIVIDVSGSMNAALSAKGTLMRYEAAAALAVLVRTITPLCQVFTYAHDCRQVPNLKGLGLLAEIQKRVGGGTNTAAALAHVQAMMPNAHRVILITDEQAHDGIHPKWTPHGYIINVAPYQPGLELTGQWVRINGWSERVVDWMKAHESENP